MMRIVREFRPADPDLLAAVQAGDLLYRHSDGVEWGFMLMQATAFNGESAVLIEKLIAPTDETLAACLAVARAYQAVLQAPLLLVKAQDPAEAQFLRKLGIKIRIVLAYLALDVSQEVQSATVPLPGTGKPAIKKAPRKGTGRDRTGALAPATDAAAGPASAKR